jgi:predicted esterase
VCFVSVFAFGRTSLGCGPAEHLRPAADVWQGERAPVWLEAPDAPPMLVYPPATATRSPAELLVLLHGMCGHPENECPWFAGTATRDRFVVCPRADLACPGGGHIWSGSSRIRNELVESFRERVTCAFPERISDEDATLVGFSLGGFVALDVAEHADATRWPQVVLIGARVAPSPSRLATAGVDGIVFASGDWDLSRASMQASARLLRRRGLRADYVGLGPIGHWFARDLQEMDGWLARAFGWLESD